MDGATGVAQVDAGDELDAIHRARQGDGEGRRKFVQLLDEPATELTTTTKSAASAENATTAQPAPASSLPHTAPKWRRRLGVLALALVCVPAIALGGAVAAVVQRLRLA